MRFVETLEIIQILKGQISSPNQVKEEQFIALELSLLQLEQKREKINDNFKGTLDELLAYVTQRSEAPTLTEHTLLNESNIRRWIQELHLLRDGGGAVTIDYEQRKGREI